MTEDNAAVARMKAFLSEAFAPWVQQLNIEPVQVTETGAVFNVPASDALARTGGIVCGQALSAIADTIGVLTLIGHNNDDRIMTTVDMTTHFMRPVMTGDVEATVTVLSNGRRMATARVDIRQAGSPKVCAGATCAYAYVGG
ncbi:PaaI family thioesterase [Nitratireductor sp. XY-223]|uniref:PaaI family thioesterase n=1 Tax=Nitratireductor sp. XY-223 TaxID=2561926 RepID=UPI001FEFC17D|nr:PaaI family thioesterase [Nitratireductor sp. XY-223]